MGERRATIHRRTAETEVWVTLNLDGQGRHEVATGVAFFDHMLAAWARHGLFDLEARVRGDLEVDSHHTVEDAGLALGEALAAAMGDKAGIARFGEAVVPMDEALVLAAVDLSGRPHLAWDVPALTAPGARLGTFDVELAREFFAALSSTGRLTLHVRQLAGGNLHHLAEACFKAVGVALGRAVRLEPRRAGQIPSTKEVL